MGGYGAYKHYFDAARAADTPTWRTVYTLGLMCVSAVYHGNLVAFVGDSGYGSDWPDPRVSPPHLRRKDD
jgi:hypothetical protein